jgi:hypothetical protein
VLDTSHHQRRLRHRLQDPVFREEFERQQRELALADAYAIEHMREREFAGAATVSYSSQDQMRFGPRTYTRELSQQIQEIVSARQRLQTPTLPLSE